MGTFSEFYTESVKTLGGSPIRRYKNTVGKRMGDQLYVHKNYAAEAIPPQILERAEKILKKEYPNFVYNSLVRGFKEGRDDKENYVRFDEAPDFDTAREPMVGYFVKVYDDGRIATGQSQSIWHHKWLWVKDDYRGFDVEKNKEWSRKWLGGMPETAKGTARTFSGQLKKYNIGEGFVPKPLDDFSTGTTGDMYAWMSPAGEMFPNGSISHFSAAKIIVSRRYGIREEDLPMMYLFGKGWFRITYSGNELFANNPSRRPTEKQVGELKNLAIEHGMSDIYWDTDDSYIKIWNIGEL